MKKILALISFIILLLHSFAQTNLPVSKWRTQFSYMNGLKVLEVGNKIYCLTESGLYYVDKADNSLTTLTKLDGLSDFDISNFNYDPVNKLILVAYRNTMIDIIKENSITQVTEIFRKSIAGKKAIYDIFFYENKAYLSCSFGIVVYDLIKLEVKETYSEIGANGKQLEIFQTTILNGNIYTATSDGILTASLSAPNLLDFNAWTNIRTGKSTMVTAFAPDLYGYTDSKLEKFNGTSWSTVVDSLNNNVKSMVVNYAVLTINTNKGIYMFNSMGNLVIKEGRVDNYTIIDADGALWHAVNVYSLIKSDLPDDKFYLPNGPPSNQSWAFATTENSVWVIPGAVTETFTPTFVRGAVYTFRDNIWIYKYGLNDPDYDSFSDMNCITVNPSNKHVFIGTFGKGLIEYFNDDIQAVYNSTNSSLRGTLSGFDTGTIIVSGVALDSKSNLWVSNRDAQNQLSVKKTDGKWEAFNLGSGVNTKVSKMVIDDNDAKWLLLQPDEGILVFDEKQPSGKRLKKMQMGSGVGNLPTNSVHSIAKDLDGRIWVGTTEGVAVFYDPYSVFTDGNYDAQKIWVENGENSGYLLATETVTAIAIDGANNKWLGTKRGIWYVSDDGSSILFSFNSKNSPLPSDYIRDIAVNEVTGEVFIATDKGIVSYRNVATKGDETHKNVYAYPNPVRPEYKGPIIITGLVRDDNVKITDISGNMVYEARSEGGQLSWDGRNFSGMEVKSGVYLIFCTNTDGTDTFVSKVLIVR